MNAFTRLAAILLCAVAVCFAVVQLGGRAVFAQLPRLEGTLNDVLAERGLRVQGLQGRWRGLNPGVFIAHVWFPAARPAASTSSSTCSRASAAIALWRGGMTVADGQLTFERTDAGWRLQGQGTQGGFDARTLLYHSDQVWIRGRLVFRDGDRAGALHVDTMWINQNAAHRFHTLLQPESRCEGCALLADGDIADGGPAAISVTARRFHLGRDLDAMLRKQFPASSPFSRASLELAVNAHWRRDRDGSERARAQLDITAHGLPEAPARVSATLAARRQEEGDYRGRLEDLTLASGNAGFRLASGGFALRGLDGQPELDVWMGAAAVEDLLAPVRAAFGTEHRSGAWLANVAPHGRIEGAVARLDADGVAFKLRGSNAAVSDYRGMPKVDRMNFVVGGHQRALRLDFEGRDFEFAFPEYFSARGPHERGAGSILFAFSPGFMGMRSPGIRGLTQGARANFGFALARPDDRDEVRVVVDGKVDRLAASRAEDYLPKALSPQLRRWLPDAVQGGELSDVRVLYRGHARRRGELPVRRVELAAHIADGRVDYHSDWPAASAVDGLLEITGAETRWRGTARAFDVALADVELRVPHRAGIADVELRGATTVARLVDFIWKTPVHEAMPFVSRAWSGSGGVDFDAALTVPLQGGELGPGDLRLDLHFQEARFDLADFGLQFDAINEDVRFVFPAELAGDALHGTLFDEPVRVAIASDEEAIRFSFEGAASVADAYRLLDIDDLGVAHGRFEFDATLSMFPASDRAMELRVESDLAGVDVALPAPLGKVASSTREFVASLQFLEPHVAVSADYGNASGWLHVEDAGIRAGAVGIGVPVPMVDAGQDRVVFSGGIAAIDAAASTALLTGAAEGGQTPFAWELRGFRIGTLGVETATFPDVALNGHFDGDDIRFVFESQKLAGQVTRSANEPWQVHLTQLTLPALESDDDPLRPEIMQRLVPADVVLDQVTIGEESYGTWRFGVVLQPEGVALTNVVGDMKGLHIEATDDVFWSRAGETRFTGSATAGDLKGVLPLWDFAPSVESERFHAAGSLRWPGSPLNFDLRHLSGDAALTVDNGRFLDIESGGARIMSLINFSTIAKRMSFDFSDVFGEGVSFDRVRAELTVDDGLASFTKPAEIVGTGSSFQLGGTVDLDSGDLNNEMVVTLPFLRSNLPWYAAFLAFSNPTSAAGVWIGQQVLKNQINRLSSGKYHIGGTYDEPEVDFVGIFDNDVDIVDIVAQPDG